MLGAERCLVFPQKQKYLFRCRDTIPGSSLLPPLPTLRQGRASRGPLPGPGPQAPGAPAGWVVLTGWVRPPTAVGGAAPQLRVSGAGPAHPSPGPLGQQLSGRPDALAAQAGSRRPPPAQPALSVNFWVNSVSPPDLPFTPNKRESVNRASEGPRGLLTRPAPPAAHQTAGLAPPAAEALTRVQGAARS